MKCIFNSYDQMSAVLRIFVIMTCFDNYVIVIFRVVTRLS